ncbi:MAG TPA: CRISPR-associated endonuclease Cas2 [Candidatus Ratteibacteria bacterium]|jgi:CRISPR-associated protein Cas2|uniref:CRISPR-associated endoribonuclease Cas2 n=1 Tax=candidate division TA06 bacterium ADurb.Bin131 TaxID=1852827 RepID=A0A1V6CEK2_UNCT6|nr:MAG: CRISPR-associated endonuclease Cas2 [candidate division TA06 bacterium ADurb.Bin131]HOC02805.1 CRISPR-associated endonuclease Cas2 [bacterium]HRS05492.1 CRISPR-associated endonuclease Cas2 [Candidatus Ratteibacteria bacterium]HON06293.1 CRISPR-associated endonuclease Cas2 [bacterium]HOQ82418.1 CRISPR-associated endonuclease Cas2 [bacterium]
MFIVISYDIADDKRRNKIAKTLENYGTRVQYSVFECIVEKDRLLKLQEELKKIIDETKDSIRFYFLCEICLKRIDIAGTGEITRDLEFYII